MAVYDEIGLGYDTTRRPDPRIGARIHAALGDAGSVVNVGAGTGSYEPPQTVVAIEPSRVMIAQRPQGSAPVIRASAESIPLPDDHADAAMALLTVHHWADLDAGIAELRRIARRRIVVFTWDQTVTGEYWLAEYFPHALARDDERAIPIGHLADLLGGARVEPVEVPHDCVDGFAAAYWRRPQAYLEPAVRAGMSLLAQLPPETLEPGLDRLADDLASGAWAERHADLLDLDTYDGGYRLLIAEP